MKSQNQILPLFINAMSAKCWNLAYPSQKYIGTIGQTVEKVILTTVYIWKTTYNPVYMDNRAYLEIA
jgi:hypothetical protein